MAAYNFIFKVERILGVRFPIKKEKRWKYSVFSEVIFWDNYYKTKGSDWGDKYKLKFDPNLEVQKEVANYFPAKKDISILDVGAGPMTFLGKKFKGNNLNITATDPLADSYDHILLKYKIQPLVRTIKCDGEKLDQLFTENEFDIVLARNSIDHSYDPENIILNMIKLSSFRVILIHAENEANNENWYGLHQWNFSLENGDFIISGKNGRVNFSKEHSRLGKIDSYINPEDGLLYTIITKMK